MDEASDSRLGKMESQMTPKEPRVLPLCAQISFPGPPTFRRADAPIGEPGLSASDEIGHLDSICEQTEILQGFVSFLYTYRSMSRVLNTKDYLKAAQDDTEDLGMAYRNAYMDLVRPLIDQMIALQSAMKGAAECIQKAAEQVSHPSDVLLERTSELLSVIVSIEFMKLVKSGMTGEVSIYKRFLQKKGESTDSEWEQKLQEVPLFLANKYGTLGSLRTETPKKSAFWLRMIKHCSTAYGDKFVLEKEKEKLATTCMCILFITKDWDLPRKGEFEDCWRILTENPLIPAYAELAYMPFDILSGLPAVASGSYISNTQGLLSMQKHFKLADKVGKFRELFKQKVEQITKMGSPTSVQVDLGETRKKGGDSVTVEWLLGSLKSMGEIAKAIIDQVAFKFACPKPSSKVAHEEGEKICQYDLCSKHNFTKADLDALIEIIGHLKTLTGCALNGERMAMEVTWRFVAVKVQGFIQGTLTPLLEAASKKKDKSEKDILAIRSHFGQWKQLDGSFIPNKKAVDVSKECVVPPSLHELDLIRLRLQNLVSPNGPCAEKGKVKGWAKDKQGEINQFVRDSRRFYNLLQYAQVIRESTNIGSLWYRESYLDLDRLMQYPVRSSLPFILSEHILGENGSGALSDSVFFPFEIYNDAAYLAVNAFKSKVLYGEIQAEVSLCVERICSSFCAAVFGFAREAAAGTELPAEVAGNLPPPSVRYAVLLKQKSLNIMGTQVDINSTTARLLNSNFEVEFRRLVKDLDDMRLIPFTAHMFRLLRCAHAFLVRLTLPLDDVDMIYRKALDAVDPGCPDTTLTHALKQCLMKASKESIYNAMTRMLIPTKVLEIKPPTKEGWGTLYAMFHVKDTAYIGINHYASMLEIMSDAELIAFVRSCTNGIGQELRKMIGTYMQVAKSVRLVETAGKEDLDTYMSDAYSDTDQRMLRDMYSAMKKAGNLTGMLFGLEAEMKANDSNTSVMGSVMRIYRDRIIENAGLFIPEEFDAEDKIGHRAFPSIWAVCEFLLCSPNLHRGLEQVSLDDLGDGPVLCAHILINLSGQRDLYNFDSIVGKILSLAKVRLVTDVKVAEGREFLVNANNVTRAQQLAQIIATPYCSPLLPRGS